VNDIIGVVAVPNISAFGLYALALTFLGLQVEMYSFSRDLEIDERNSRKSGRLSGEAQGSRARSSDLQSEGTPRSAARAGAPRGPVLRQAWSPGVDVAGSA
jgi:hypothetical protein